MSKTEKHQPRKIYSKRKKYSVDQQKVMNYFSYVEKKRQYYKKLEIGISNDLVEFKKKKEFQEFVMDN